MMDDGVGRLQIPGGLMKSGVLWNLNDTLGPRINLLKYMTALSYRYSAFAYTKSLTHIFTTLSFPAAQLTSPIPY